MRFNNFSVRARLETLEQHYKEARERSLPHVLFFDTEADYINASERGESAPVNIIEGADLMDAGQLGLDEYMKKYPETPIFSTYADSKAAIIAGGLPRNVAFIVNEPAPAWLFADSVGLWICPEGADGWHKLAEWKAPEAAETTTAGGE